jgi:hypothetical protein
MLDVVDPQSLRIFCGKSLDAIEEQYVAELEFGDLLDTFSEAEMADSYRNSLEEGIEIDESLWKTLDSLVARVLVESTDSSRAGAGD